MCFRDLGLLGFRGYSAILGDLGDYIESYREWGYCVSYLGESKGKELESYYSL